MKPKLMRDMREVGITRTYFLPNSYCLCQGIVRNVRVVTQGIQHQCIAAAYFVQLLR